MPIAYLACIETQRRVLGTRGRPAPTIPMTRSLVVGQINLNDAKVLDRVLSVLRGLAASPEHYRSLRVKNGLYFEATDRTLPSQPGWYVLLVGTIPVYAGQADNLDYRLNSKNGSLDNFANSTRKWDAERNFVKKLCDIGVFPELRTWFVTAAEFAQEVGVAFPLSELDTNNVEKFIDLHRGFLEFIVSEPSFNTR